MHKFLLWAALALAAFSMPSLAAEPASLAATKEETLKGQRQETVSLGNNRFLIFSGSPGGAEPDQYGYTLDLIKIEAGMPRFEPLFIEDYDLDSDTISFSAGVAFPAVSYHFDKASGTLAYTSKDPESGASVQYTYRLDGDTFTLRQVLMQKPADCTTPPCAAAPPKVLYKAKDDEKTIGGLNAAK